MAVKRVVGWLMLLGVVSQLTTPGVTRVVQRFIQLLVTSTVWFLLAWRYGPVSFCHKSVFCRNRWTNQAVFGMGAFFHPSYTVLKGNSGISKNKGTFLWNFVPNSWLRNFRSVILIVEMCYRLSSTKLDAQSMINWTVIGHLSWQYLRAPTLDH